MTETTQATQTSQVPATQDQEQAHTNIKGITSDLNTLAVIMHQNSVNKGFYDKYMKARKIIEDLGDTDLLYDYDQLFFAQRIALIHSELSEALEGNRKSLMDDHIQHRKMEDIEIVDALIRILDLAGFRKMDLNVLVAEKFMYNTGRPYLHGKKY